jgi:hypothetical protein
MCSQFCKSCEKEFEEGEEKIALDEYGNDYICLECEDDLKNYPCCNGYGCFKCQ